MRVASVFSVGALSLLSIASSLRVEFNNFMSATPNNGITFDTTDMHALPQNLLMTMDGYYSNSDSVSCSVTEEEVNSGTVTVLLGISKCLNDSSIHMIESWVDSIKDQKMTYFKDGGDYNIEFTTAIIPGECEARSESNKKGLEDEFDASWEEEKKEGGVELLSEDAQRAQVDRISAFSRFGRVLYGLPDTREDVPIAVISFCNEENSFNEIEKYEHTMQITHTFNFQICKSGESCDGHFENCLLLNEDVDIFMYNPFAVVRSFHCAMLPGGIPVSYLDTEGTRQCFCSCPAGYEQHVDRTGHYYCAEVDTEVCPCSWSTHEYGFKLENTENLKECKFTKIATKWRVPVPFPSDNYVADERVNDHDDSSDLENGPHIDVSVTMEKKKIYNKFKLAEFFDVIRGDYSQGPFPPNFNELIPDGHGGDEMASWIVFTPDKELGDTETYHYTWSDYQINRQSKIDDLTFTHYGRYLLEVDANDYTQSAQCKGCISIVDQFRPVATTKCPASFCDDRTSLCEGFDVSTSTLNPTNLGVVNSLVQDVYTFQTKAENDACSDNRCDYEDFSLKDFFETEYCSERSYKDYGPKCFNQDEIEKDLFKEGSKLFDNPLLVNGAVVQDHVVVPQGQCTRCCSYTNRLQELWTDYTCNYNADTQQCSGDSSQECSFHQCLVLFGETVATALARINPDIVEESERVIEKLVQKGYQSQTQIHRSLQCSQFNGEDGDCSYSAKVSDLIQTQVHRTFLDDDVDPKNYVFWRYSIGESTWELFGQNEEEYEFNQAETKIILEAWSQCGLVRKFYFYVYLHLNSDIRVCDKFKEMWYQTSVARMNIDAPVCTYPGSDFAELTFDYRPNIGLQYHRDQLRMNVSHVTCYLSVEGRQPVEILDVNSESPEIIQRFAVETLNNAETKIETNVHVTCDFTYKRYDDSTLTHTCDRDFTIVDCTHPEFEVPHGECEFEDCAGVDLPGPYEACGGKVIKSTPELTYVREEEVDCCQACDTTTTTCEAILGLPREEDDIKRCVPQFENGIYEYQSYELGNEFMAAGKNLVANNAVVTALLSASAMVAFVALIVVRRRRAAEKATIDDAYYPLLH